MAKYIVRYGVMRFLGSFSAPGRYEYARGTRVIARTDRGLEIGEVLGESSEYALSCLKGPTEGQIIRQATSNDTNELKRMDQQAREEFKVCRQYVEKLELPMQLVDIEHIFGGERIVIYYLAESRVDFRELVRQLAGEFQTRIEMRQIGVRDEAKLLADFGDCGNPVCCNNHLVQMPPVSMKMAKLQKATLDPTKISGRCGRLKCCLRYEYDVYDRIQRELPRVGSRVDTPEGPARVVGHEIIAGKLVVETDDRRRLVVDTADTSPLTDDKSAQKETDKQEGKQNNKQDSKQENRNNNKRATR